MILRSYETPLGCIILNDRRLVIPYAKNVDLPASVRDHLPDDAQDIFRAAFNSAYEKHDGDEEAVFSIAWAAVKRLYVKEGGQWVPRGVTG